MKSEDVMEIRGALDLLRRDVKAAKSDIHEFVMDGMEHGAGLQRYLRHRRQEGNRRSVWSEDIFRSYSPEGR